MNARKWKKEAYVVFVLCFLSISNFACAQKWTEETAREEAFRDIKYSIDLTQYPTLDPNFEENQKALREGGRQRIADRFITANPVPPIYYVVSKLGNKGDVQSTMFYGKDGRLLSVRLFSCPGYPRVAYFYCVDKESCRWKDEEYEPGELMSVSLHVSGSEAFYFRHDSRFSGHVK
ncbi:MAG: hypothetical protein ISS33_05950 [Candidatus Omnitrophica bacterium]|nr:hypothetical protein [Candidatus Omnitrophota bacterium]